MTGDQLLYSSLGNCLQNDYFSFCHIQSYLELSFKLKRLMVVGQGFFFVIFAIILTYALN